jgi:hypothetical protein
VKLGTHKIVALAAVDETVHDSDDLQPEIKKLFATHISEEDEIVKEHF